jgi:hypothetical protein
LVYLDINGQLISLDDRIRLPPRTPSNEEWGLGLTAMRALVAKISDARVILGGRTEDFKGRMPGIAEETLKMFQARKPLFLLGGFGGCARDITEDLRLTPRNSLTKTPWPGRSSFERFSSSDLNNGLDAQENEILASTHHIDEAVTLILRGLLRLTEDSST